MLLFLFDFIPVCGIIPWSIIMPRLKGHPVFLYYLYLFLSLLIFSSLFPSLFLLCFFLFNTEKSTSNTYVGHVFIREKLAKWYDETRSLSRVSHDFFPFASTRVIGIVSVSLGIFFPRYVILL